MASHQPTIIPTLDPRNLCPPGKHHDSHEPDICIDCSDETYNHGGMHYGREWCYSIPPNQNEFKYLDKINVQCGRYYIGNPMYHNGEYEFGCVDAPPPTDSPSFNPSDTPSYNPSEIPSFSPSNTPSYNPSEIPSYNPSDGPSYNPSEIPSFSPSNTPSILPSGHPTIFPTAIDPIAVTDGRAWMFSTYSLGAVILLCIIKKIWKSKRTRAAVTKREIPMVVIPTTGLTSQDSLRETYSEGT